MVTELGNHTTSDKLLYMTLAQLMIILWVIPNVYLATSFPHANKERILLDKMYLPSESSLCNASSDAYTVKI